MMSPSKWGKVTSINEIVSPKHISNRVPQQTSLRICQLKCCYCWCWCWRCCCWCCLRPLLFHQAKTCTQMFNIDCLYFVLISGKNVEWLAKSLKFNSHFENISSWWEIDKVESLYRKKIKVGTFIDDGLYSHSSGFAGNIESESIKQRYNRNEERIEKVTSNLPFKRWTSC